MNVLVVEPMKKPYLKDIGSDLESLQHEVGGYIEAVYPFEEQVCLICNEEGKLDGLLLNRAIYGEVGEMVDIIAGTFLVAGLNEDDFSALPDDLAEKFGKLFESPEVFYSVNGQICMEKVEPVVELTPEEAWRQELHATQECAKEIGNGGLAGAFNDRKLKAYIAGMTQKHGVERFGLVLAVTINNAPEDSRYSPAVKKWAAGIAPFPQAPDHEGVPRPFEELCVKEHPAIVNAVVQAYMKERERSQPERDEGR
jgi:hypothetical protein